MQRPGRPGLHAVIRDPIYPDSDGKPMSDNTLQYEWIVTLKENLDEMLEDFVAGNLLWYAQEGYPKVRAAPDVLVALGRPKGYRGSYKTWAEDGVIPAVVFEVLSPGNTLNEMVRKHQFYQRHGVTEYYVLDPEKGWWTGWVRQGELLQDVTDMHGFVSPLLGIRFEHGGNKAAVFYPDGRRFLTFGEVARLAREATALEAALSEKEAALSEKDAEIARLRAALEQATRS